MRMFLKIETQCESIILKLYSTILMNRQALSNLINEGTYRMSGLSP